MRLWSISPEYLDRQGLLACWREGLLAQSCLIKGEYINCKYCLGKGYFSLQNLPDCGHCHGKGKKKTPYYNHTQLNRFKIANNSLGHIGYYLWEIWHEANKRGYNFNLYKIKNPYISTDALVVTKGQLEYEFKHLYDKLIQRKSDKAMLLRPILFNKKRKNMIKVHPLFKAVEGPIEEWEKV